MRKYVIGGIVLLPLLLTFSHAEQSWSVDPPAQPWVFSSEDSGTSSYLGVDIADVTTERLSALKLKEEKGVEVTMVPFKGGGEAQQGIIGGQVPFMFSTTVGILPHVRSGR